MSRYVALVLVVACAALSSVRADTYRDALMELYSATDGANWKNNSGWGSTANYCTWYGVQCPLHTTADITEVGAWEVDLCPLCWAFSAS